MQPISAISIYFLFWFLSLFFVLPFGVRTEQDIGNEPAPGHAESAPHRFSFGKAALRTTLLSGALFGLFYANFSYGWLGIDALDFLKPEHMRGGPNS